jgi:hypothetical protein
MQYPKAYKDYNTQYPKTEVISGCLWDTVNYTSTVTLQATFFMATRATLDLSNMRVSGQLPYPMAFLARAIRFYLKMAPYSLNVPAAGNVEAAAMDTIALLINSGALVITIGDKQYGAFPLWTIPSGGGPFGVIGTTNVLIGGANVSYGSIGYPHIMNVMTFAQPLFIDAQMNFRVDIYWAAALTIVQTPLPMSVVLEGDILRPAQ